MSRGAPDGAVVLVRAASVLAGANRALRTLLPNGAACAACAAYVMANPRTAELVTDTTFSNLNAFLFHLPRTTKSINLRVPNRCSTVAAMMLETVGFDGLRRPSRAGLPVGPFVAVAFAASHLS